MSQSRTHGCNELAPLKETINLRFFQDKIPSKRWQKLAEDALFDKINENRENIEKFKNLKALYAIVHGYWREGDDYRLHWMLDSITHQTPYAKSMLVEAQSFYSPTLFAFIVGVILLINRATEQGQLDKSWWVGMVKEEKFSSLVPASPFSILMLTFAFCSMMLYIGEFNGNVGYINIHQSRNKIANALNKIRLYPTSELEALSTRYKDYRDGKHLLTDLDWRSLFNYVNQLKKTEKPNANELAAISYNPSPRPYRYPSNRW
jgi:hypothetical protein